MVRQTKAQDPTFHTFYQTDITNKDLTFSINTSRFMKQRAIIIIYNKYKKMSPIHASELCVRILKLKFSNI